MKKFYAFFLLAFFLTGCSLNDFKASFFNAKREATEAVTNLKNEATKTINTVETKTQQVKETSESIKQAADSLSDAAEDIKELTSGDE